jgi:AraC-like DNA-binding protein
VTRTPAPTHRCDVLRSPWPGVHAACTDSARHYGRHWHGTFGLGLIDDGAQRSASGIGTVDAYAGDLVTTNPGEVHDGRPLGGPARRWRTVYFEPDAIAPLLGAGVEIARPVLYDPALRRALLALLDELAAWTARAGETLACEAALVRTGALLRARHVSAPSAPRHADADMRPVRERLADELHDPPTLADLARNAGLSRWQLLRRFEKAYGLPPHAWLLQQRAERARRAIADGASLAVAAAASGFADQSHMTRVFVRRYGFTPGAWRRAQ